MKSRMKWVGQVDRMDKVCKPRKATEEEDGEDRKAAVYVINCIEREVKKAEMEDKHLRTVS